MAEVDRWVFTICCGAVLCGAVSVLLPGRGMERLMRMVLGLFMLCCLLLPIGTRFSLPELTPEAAVSVVDDTAGEVTDFFLQDTLERSREQLRRQAAEELREYGINEEDIQIYIEAKGTDDPKDTAGITAELTLPGALREHREELQPLLEKRLDIAVRLRFDGEEP